MKRRRRSVIVVLAIVLGIVLLALLIVPLLMPIPPLQDTKPPEELADADSRFATVNGVRVHYKMAGQGEPVFVLLHGFASSAYSWREVMAPLAELGTVIAFDRPAFGLTERPLPGQWSGDNPYSLDAQVDLTLGLMDQLGVDKAILVGNSAGGAVAAKTALEHPERVQALALVSPAVSGGGSPGFASRIMSIPQIDRFGPLITRRFASLGETLGRTAWHDPSKLTPEGWEGYTKPLQADNWDVGLWEFTKASRPQDLASRLPSLAMPLLILTGDDDRVVPTERTVQLAEQLPSAKLVVIPDSGHVAHEETPAAFMQAFKDFLSTLK